MIVFNEFIDYRFLYLTIELTGDEGTPLNESLLAHESWFRLSPFFGTFALMALWEVMAPRRALEVAKGIRWANNLTLVVLNTFLLRIIFPTTAVGLALHVAEHDEGLLNQMNLPGFARFAIGMVALDLAIYLQHILFHAVPALWRLHRVHHADLDFDVTTGARFHPLEIVLSMLIKFAAIIVLGPPAVAVLAFEILLNATALFNHSNVRLPVRLDDVLRRLIVTPDMHRVHHSIVPDETNHNFGFNLSVWDRLLGTYRGQPAGGHVTMTIGIPDYRSPHQINRLDGMLLMPFVGAVTESTNKHRPGNTPTTFSS